MGHLNRVELIGNLGRDPEVRHTSDGKPYVNLNVATNESWKNDRGEKQERVEWHRVVVFNERIGEVLQKHVRKGQLVRIVGKMRTRKWDDHGTERYTTEVIVDFAGELTLLGPTTPAGEDRQERAA